MKVEFRAVSAFSDEHINRNIEHARSLGLPTIDQYRPTGPLAVVGGGLSALGYVETLRRWEGDVWAINGAWRWCVENDIRASFFSIDPNTVVGKMCWGTNEAILAERCDPVAFGVAPTTYLYPGTLGGCSSAGAAIVAGFKSGHQQITLFGTECNFQQGRSHVYGHAKPDHELIVKCAGMHFLTQPNLALQAKELAIMILEAQGLVRETSGGFLRAMVNAKCEYDIVETTPGFEDTLTVADEPASG
jgi:hypothetical protein